MLERYGRKYLSFIVFDSPFVRSNVRTDGWMDVRLSFFWRSVSNCALNMQFLYFSLEKYGIRYPNFLLKNGWVFKSQESRLFKFVQNFLLFFLNCCSFCDSSLSYTRSLHLWRYYLPNCRHQEWMNKFEEKPKNNAFMPYTTRLVYQNGDLMSKIPRWKQAFVVS